MPLFWLQGGLGGARASWPARLEPKPPAASLKSVRLRHPGGCSWRGKWGLAKAERWTTRLLASPLTGRVEGEIGLGTAISARARHLVARRNGGRPARLVAIWTAGSGDPHLVGRLTSVTIVPAGLLTIVLALRLRRSNWLDDETRLGWTVLRLAFCSYLAGAILDFAWTAVPAASSLTSLAPVLQIAAYLLETVGLGLLPMAWRSRSDSVVFGLDVSIVAWGAAILAVARQVLDGPASPPLG